MYRNIGVIGAGTIGTGLAVDLVLHNINVVLVDAAVEALERSRAEILKVVRFAPLIKKSAPHLSVDEALERIHFVTDIAEVGACDFIVENATENVTIKEGIYRRLDRICQPDVCFGVNTSCIAITQIASFTARPERVIGMHFMNPVYLKAHVEVIRGYHTSEECIEIARGLLKLLEKEAIMVNDYPGFVSNRVSHLFMNEAAFVVQDQVATPKAVDDIFKKCYGHTMGPLETADLIGLDTVVNSLDVLYQSYQDPKFRCCPLLRKMVAAGLLGTKSGQGFYKYSK
ncbi:MAG TPA: 3-hydroxyacyl-CoA dehydrogenase NAD-binding domain-containing protein [Ktedonobacteraceae bacterium]|nr:3-hydroxyacyl-CoA dehydrogenase NAD-binding domain-containing protein [Ktedonobacteraceae bacterium]